MGSQAKKALRAAVSCGFPLTALLSVVRPGRSAVFADQAAEDLPALDPCGDINDVGWSAQRGFLLQALVRTVLVIVPGVFGQDLAEMPPAGDQHVIQALAAQRAHEPLRAGVRPRGPDRRLNHPRAVPGEDATECRGELTVPVTDQELVATRGRML
jgi:hypothetical protein